MTTKDFHLSDVLSITTSRLVSTRHIDGVYDILNWMSGEDLFTHQLPRVSHEAKAVLLRVHPQLTAITGEDVTRENWPQWLTDKIGRFGETLPVPQMTAEEHQHLDMMEELSRVRAAWREEGSY